MTSYEFDENETPLDDGDYEYAGDDDEDDMNHVQAIMMTMMMMMMMIVMTKNQSLEITMPIRNKSQASFTDEMNLIDYVIEEEKEIGGNKGEDSLSTSRSTTYSK